MKASERSDEQSDRHDACQKSQWNQSYKSAAPNTAFRYESKLLDWTIGFIDRMCRHGFLLSTLTAKRSYLTRVLLYKRLRHDQRTLRPLYGMPGHDPHLAPARSGHCHQEQYEQQMPRYPFAMGEPSHPLSPE